MDGTPGEKRTELMRRFYNGVAEIPNVKVYGDSRRTEAAAIVSLNIGDYDSAEISDELSGRYGIVTRSGAHCAPLMHEALEQRYRVRSDSVFPIIIRKRKLTRQSAP